MFLHNFIIYFNTINLKADNLFIDIIDTIVILALYHLDSLFEIEAETWGKVV